MSREQKPTLKQFNQLFEKEMLNLEQQDQKEFLVPKNLN